MSSQQPSPIGVYDSGFGGLTVLRQLRRALPELDYVYLGDSGRAPYGGRDVDTVLDFSEQCIERLFGEGCRVVVVACHTVSCVALRHLQQRYGSEERRVLGVTIPAAEAAVAQTRGHIGFVERVLGCHVFPDSNATGAGENPQWLYTVTFDGRELWGAASDPDLKISVDAWQSYLEPA